MLSFRLWTIFYVFALSAAAMATFGALGIFVAAIVLGFWAWIYNGPEPTSCLQWAILFFLIVTALVLLLPAVQVARESSRSGTCINNLKNIALATIAHEAAHGHFPAAHTVDAKNQPLHSWRVLLLPRLERQDIFETVKFDEPWDSLSNRKWSTVALDHYQCPSEGSTAAITSYFAIVGPQTAWPPTGDRKMSGLTDGPEQTILLIEARGRNTQWAEPKDLTYAEAVDLLSKPIEPEEAHHRDNGFFYKPSLGRSVAFADGHVALIQCPIDRKLAEALLTVAGGEKINLSTIRSITEPQLDYSKCYGVVLFIILSLLPAMWVRPRTRDSAVAEARSGRRE
ncbi:MAG TPA: DUF1559 domain-containing protein [Lacipirellulaceae bacterium]